MSDEDKLERLLDLAAEASAFGLSDSDSAEYAKLREELLSVLNEVTE